MPWLTRVCFFKVVYLVVGIGFALGCDSVKSVHSGDFNSAASSCDDFIKEAYAVSYYQLFRQSANCLPCHAEGGEAGQSRWFAAQNFGFAFQRFQSIGRTKVERMAIDENHRSPKTGLHLQPAIESFNQRWVESEDKASLCRGQLAVITLAKAIPDAITTVNSPNAPVGATPWTSMNWDLDSEVQSAAWAGKIKTEVTFQIRKVDLEGEDQDFYQVRELSARVTAAGEGSPPIFPNFTFQRLLLLRQGGLDADFTAWRELNVTINSPSLTPLIPGSGYFDLYVQAGETLALSFEAILRDGATIY